MLATDFTDHLIAWGTIFLGGFTLLLFLATWRLVVQTRAAAATARSALKADVEPLLIDVSPSAAAPPDMVRTATGELERFVLAFGAERVQPTLIDPRTAYVALVDGAIYVSVPLRNVGRGLARVLGARFESTDKQTEVTVRRQMVPPGESTRIDVVCRQPPLALARLIEIAGEGPTCVVKYGDAGGTQIFEARFNLACSAGWWQVADLHHRVVPSRAAPRWVLDNMTVGTLGLRFSFDRAGSDPITRRDIVSARLPFGLKLQLSRKHLHAEDSLQKGGSR